MGVNTIGFHMHTLIKEFLKYTQIHRNNLTKYQK